MQMHRAVVVAIKGIEVALMVETMEMLQVMVELRAVALKKDQPHTNLMYQAESKTNHNTKRTTL